MGCDWSGFGASGKRGGDLVGDASPLYKTGVMDESDPRRLVEDGEVRANAVRFDAAEGPIQGVSGVTPGLHAGELELARASLGAGLARDQRPETEDEFDQPALAWLASDRQVLVRMGLKSQRC